MKIRFRKLLPISVGGLEVGCESNCRRRHVSSIIFHVVAFVDVFLKFTLPLRVRAVLFQEVPRSANREQIAGEWAAIWDLAVSYDSELPNPIAQDHDGMDSFAMALLFLRNRQAHSTDGVLRLIIRRGDQNYTIPIAGRGVIPSIDRLRGPIRALACMIRARAQFSGGRTWNERQIAEWNEIIAHVETVVRDNADRRYDTVSRIGAEFLRRYT